MRSIPFFSASFSASSLLSLGAVATLAGSAAAHVSIASGPAGANKSQIISFGVGHGCETAAGKHLDTIKIRVTIPAGVTGVRALFSDFGKPTLVKSGEVVTHVEWTKARADLLDGDDSYYELKIRARTPATAFAKLGFVVEQTCQDSATDEQMVVSWDQPDGVTTGNPAPQLVVVPSHGTGWVQLEVPRALTQDEIPLYLGDAQIVWRGTAAYSPNAATAALIAATPGVTALAGGLAANDKIWVRY